ncbi:GNAT family N-acetyltransferase [Salinisphaera sp. T31B1]|uniref:GNAT family N-acetyltransferase n=1 Tax=Salinisphaera sp. T31B1 TaxID=727963 RepID=UPI003340EF12
MSVRRALGRDLDAIEALERACFTIDAQSRRSLAYLLGRANSAVFLAEADSVVLGDVIVLYRRSSLVARVYSIAVAVPARGRGVARALLSAAEEDARARGCRTMHAEARTGNLASRALFTTNGYDTGARLAAYYPDGEDGIRLFKRLPEPISNP